jgi:hypothetical protein
LNLYNIFRDTSKVGSKKKNPEDYFWNKFINNKNNSVEDIGGKKTVYRATVE